MIGKTNATNATGGLGRFLGKYTTVNGVLTITFPQEYYSGGVFAKEPDGYSSLNCTAVRAIDEQGPGYYHEDWASITLSSSGSVVGTGFVQSSYSGSNMTLTWVIVPDDSLPDQEYDIYVF